MDDLQRLLEEQKKLDKKVSVRAWQWQVAHADGERVQVQNFGTYSN